MDTLAPPVVAVVVAHDPGPWFEETLASLASQDYAELSVLILDGGSRDDLTTRVATVLPTAFVRRFEENRGFGATVNEALTMVDGADYFLVCHDDVALFPDAVHLMVEEAFRSNAGMVTPKVVSWEDPERLVHVGMTADKGGSVVERVQPHEIDHGQHDAVRDVFVAPGGASLIRADLLDELGGFDPAIVAMGEDLDLSWRAHVVGARIIVAPDARVRPPRGAGRRAIAAVYSDRGPRRAAGAVPPVPHGPDSHSRSCSAATSCWPCSSVTELRSTCIRVVPQVLRPGRRRGHRGRTGRQPGAGPGGGRRLAVEPRAPVGHPAQRKELQAHRRLSDKEVRLLQVGGSARLSVLPPPGVPARVPRGPRRRAGRRRGRRCRSRSGGPATGPIRRR